MAGHEITLTIISGPDAGTRFDIKGPTLVGRDAGCDVVLSDISISSRHARITIDPSLKVTDLNSANHTYVNNQAVTDSPLRSGDVIVFGTIAARIEIRDREGEQKSQKAKSRKVLLYSVIGVLLVVLAVMMIVMQRKEARLLTETPLSSNGLSARLAYPGVMTSHFPLASEFEPATPNARIARALTPWWTLPQMPATRGELDISRVLPPDPPEREYLASRRWTDRPPRLGARRIVLGPTLRQSLTLGAYRSVEWHYSNADLADTEPLNFVLTLQSWDGLPISADIAWVGLNRPAYEKGQATTRPAVPRKYPFIVPDTLWSKRTETVQAAHVSYTAQRSLFLHFEKVGEALYMVSFDYPAHQRPRLEALAEELMEAQDLSGRRRPQTEEQMRELAILLEKEGDAFVPEFTSWNFDDFERYDRKSNLFRAFARYMKALEYRQVVDDWLNNPDYERLLSKALLIYNYVEDDRSLFRRLFWQVEDGIGAHLMRRAGLRDVNEHLGTLHLIVYEGTDTQTRITLSDGTEHNIALTPDEWLMYTHLRKIAVRQMEGR